MAVDKEKVWCLVNKAKANNLENLYSHASLNDRDVFQEI